MRSLKLRTVFVAAVVVCLSILFLSPTVEGSCDFPLGACTPFRDCKESCIKFKTRAGQTFFDGKCRPRDRPSVWTACFCCYYDSIGAQ
ncbi:Low-molecular-weight cysteine-rich family [Arabidopsis suecica]|uniref:Low-molecular-weight cysteine-rich family n=1 Tax=Arabidopsis suecica TaxID=45249 RepID=A0A8T1YKP5_ARASU|nr:Low-molecular-weight cysteine-rich family [Arabidopsis suecica]